MKNRPKNPYQNFVVYYKENFLFNSLAVVLLTVFFVIFVVGLIDNYIIVGRSLILNRLILLAAITFSGIGVFYFLFTIYRNFGKQKCVSFQDGILTFYETPLSKNPISITIAEIADAEIRHPKTNGRTSQAILLLSFTYGGKKFLIADTNLRDDEFSRVCNMVVKRSNRCKACQSTKVTWAGETGHCHNCESITPKNSDEFNWDNAYKA